MRDVVASGDAIVETPRGLVFVRGGLVGEQLRIELDPKRGRIQRGHVLEVLKPSSERVAPPCVHAERCGGCALMHASSAEQRRLRLGFLREALRKAGMASEVPVLESTSAQEVGYRRRARLSFRIAGKRRELGFHRERSSELRDIDVCLVLVPALRDALAVLRARLLAELSGEGEVRLALGAGERPVAVVRTPGVQLPSLYTVAGALVDEGQFAGIALFAAGASSPAQFGDAREWSEGYDGLPLEGTVGGFSQAHAATNHALVSRVLERAEPSGARVLELYAGTGNLTVALARDAASYVAVEQAPDAVAALRRNLSARGLRAKVIEGDVLALRERLAKADVVLLDPPRTGAPEVLSTLAVGKPKRIVYVSCDPATLARDVSALRDRYHVSFIEAFEMFPQTAEIETLLVLERTR